MNHGASRQAPGQAPSQSTGLAGRGAHWVGEGASRCMYLALLPLCCWLAWEAAWCGEGEQRQPAGLPRTPSAQLSAARQAQARADLLRASYEAKYGRPDAMPGGEEDAAAQVVGAYQEAMAKAGLTSLGAYCGLRLAGFHQFRGDYASAVGVAERVARDFAGTRDEAKAAVTIGLIHLQARRDPGAAIAWFRRVRRPLAADEHGPVARGEYSEAHKLFITAQMLLAKSEAMLGHREDAERRHRYLASRYPHFGPNLLREGQADLEEAQAFRSERPGHAWERSEPRLLMNRELSEHMALDALLDHAMPEDPGVPDRRGDHGRIRPWSAKAAAPSRAAAAAKASPRGDGGGRGSHTYLTVLFCPAAIAGLSLAALALLRRLRVRKEAGS